MLLTLPCALRQSSITLGVATTHKIQESCVLNVEDSPEAYIYTSRFAKDLSLLRPSPPMEIDQRKRQEKETGYELCG